MGKSTWIFLIILILVLIIGGYLFSQKFNIALKEKVEGGSSRSNNFKESEIKCNVGESRFTPIPEGVGAGGPITGIERYSFFNGESLDLCCSDASTLQGDLNYKSCILTQNNIITHEILWKKVDNSLIKVKEVEPQFGGTCTYYFNSDGSIESRSCF